MEKPWPDTKCLSVDRWNEILEFGVATGVSISYGLNGLYGRASPSTPMNTSNLQAFLEATAAMDPSLSQPLWAYQLGNELGNGSPGNYRADPDALANDVLRVRAIINSLWSAEGGGGRALAAASARPLFVGPDSAPSSAYYEPYLAIAAPALNATTFHSYLCGSRSGGGGPCQAALLDPTAIAGDDGAAHDTLDYAKGSPVPDLHVWGGEVGPAYGGGVTGLSNRYGDMVWWLDHLARLQAIGVQTFARSTLIGGSYELVNRSTHDPHPSYFASLAYSRLMGGLSLVTSSSQIAVTAHGTCTAGRTAADAPHEPPHTAARPSRAVPGASVLEHRFAGQVAARRLRDSTLAASPCSAALLAGSGAVTAVVANLNETQPAPVNVTVDGYTGDDPACIWRFRSEAAATGAGPLYGADGVQWLSTPTGRAADGTWETLAVGPAPQYELPSLDTPIVVDAVGGIVPVDLGVFEYAFVVVPSAGVAACMQ